MDRPLLIKEGINRCLISEIEFVGRSNENVPMSPLFQGTQNGGSNHASVSSHVDGGVKIKNSHGVEGTTSIDESA